MSLTLVPCSNPSLWDAFVAASPQGSVFCRTAFLDALGAEYDLWFVEENGSPQAGAVILKRDGEPLLAPHTFTMYQGVLFAADGCAALPHRRAKWMLEVSETLVSQLAERYSRLSFCLHHAVDDLRGLQWFHYHEPHLGQFAITLAYTGLIDLTAVPGFDAYLATVRKTRRYEYRQAQERGVTAELSSDIEALDRLHQRTFERQQIERGGAEARLVHSITAAALRHGFGELLLCREASGAPASATLFLYDERCAYYLFGANDPAHRGLNSGTFLFLENVRRCFERGTPLVDVVGINSPNRGDFKTSFNAAPKPYFAATWERPV
ncbi:MAG TPA: GNAT family N-acetyltransferase [Candidatus Acidoferrales bacterium]|nr:GNAT family N-acetyltransferase [Candidatus Acidoferrales bacterium]